MVLVFPSKLTEEETMLQAKYAKLRKKKRQLAASKNPDAAEKAEKEAAKKAAATANAKDAKEVAKKLIRTGALPKIQKVSTGKLVLRKCSFLLYKCTH